MNCRILCLILFSSLILLTLSIPSIAQVSYGLKLSTARNITYSRQCFDNNGTVTKTKYTTAFNIHGLGLTLNIPLKDKLALQPEINYFTIINSKEAFGYHVLSIPVLLVYKPTTSVEVEAGPSLERRFFSTNNKRMNELLIPDINLGLHVGASYWFNNKWAASMRYSIEGFRTKYNLELFSSSDPDGLLISDALKDCRPGYRNTYITASVKYKLY